MLRLFEEWECSVAEVQLAAGDTLVLYTDSVTEAVNAQDERFGESRHIDMMLAQCHLLVRALLETIVQTVQKFSAGEQADDITVVVARCDSSDTSPSGECARPINNRPGRPPLKSSSPLR